MRSTVAVAGPASADDAWERYALPRRWPDWSPQIRSVEASAPRLVPGMTGTVHGPPFVSVSFTVEQVDEAARRWSWRVHAGPLTMRLEHEVLERAEGCATTLTVEAAPPVAIAYAQLAKIALVRLVR